MKTSATGIYGQQNRVIHIALGQLGLPYEDNRELWTSVMTGLSRRPVDSLTRLTLTERNDFILHLKKKGAKVKKPFVPSALGGWCKNDEERTVSTAAGRPLAVPPEKRPLVSKIRAILADLGLEWEYADGIARQMGFGAAVVEWCGVDQLYKVAQALAVHQRQQGRPAAGNGGGRWTKK